MGQAWLNQSQDTGGGATAGSDVITEGAEPAADPHKEEEEKANKKNKRKSIFNLMSSKK